MTKRNLVVASTRHHHARLLKYYPRRHCAPSLIKSRFFPHTTNLLTVPTFLHFEIPFYVYTRGILGCLLGFWPLGQNPAGAISRIKDLWLNAQVAIKTVNISTLRCCFAEGGTEFFISGYRTESKLIFPPTNQILNL